MRVEIKRGKGHIEEGLACVIRRTFVAQRKATTRPKERSKRLPLPWREIWRLRSENNKRRERIQARKVNDPNSRSEKKTTNKENSRENQKKQKIKVKSFTGGRT